MIPPTNGINTRKYRKGENPASLNLLTPIARPGIKIAIEYIHEINTKPVATVTAPKIIPMIKLTNTGIQNSFLFDVPLKSSPLCHMLMYSFI